MWWKNDIISHSSTKSLVLPLHKFTIRNLDLFFPFFGETKFFNSTVYLLISQYFGRMEKKLSCQKVGLHSVDFSQFELKSYAMKESLRGTSRMFFHCTLECLCPYVPATSFRLMALQNKVECHCYNETNIPSC